MRLDTKFWRACHADTALCGAEEIVRYYLENGPTALLSGIILHPTNSFGVDGYLALLVGQQVAHAKPYSPSPAEAKMWRDRVAQFGQEASRAMSVAECLQALRHAGWLKKQAA